MYLSKIWLFLLGVAAAAALAIAIIVPRPAARAIAEVERERLERAQITARSLLATTSRQWIDKALEASNDGKLRDILEGASNPAKLDELHTQLTDKLARFATGLKGVDLQIAVDASGRVIGRAGLEGAEWKDSIAGLPLVDDALRGWSRDDLWAIDGKLYVVGAAPIQSDRSSGKIIGAYLVGGAVTLDFANRLKANLGAEIAFFANNTYSAASVDRPLVDDLTKEFTKQKDSMAAAGHSTPVALSRAGTEYLAILAPLPGLAGASDSFYAVLMPRPKARGLMATLKVIDGSDKKQIPWIMLIGLVILVIGGGIALQVMEHDLPIRRLQEAVGRLAKGEISKLDDTAHKGKYGSIARSVNMALERTERDAAKGAPRKSLGDVLGPPPAAPSMSSIPGIPAIPPAPPPRGSGIPAIPPAPAAAAPAFKLELPGAPKAATAAPPAAPPSFAPPAPPPAFAPQAPSLPIPPPPRMAAPAQPSEPFTPLDLPSVGDLVVPVATFAGERDEVGRHALDRAGGGGAEEAYHRQVFEEFLGLKKKCGEPTEGLTFDKFAVKLRANRDQLVEKYGAKSVKFQVYVKDGKAALKATPVK